jgi:hypothetical protein
MARGTYAPGSSSKKVPVQHPSEAEGGLQFQPLEPPYDALHHNHYDDATSMRSSTHHRGTEDGAAHAAGGFHSYMSDERSDAATDTTSALRRFSTLQQRADVWNDHGGSASRSPQMDGNEGNAAVHSDEPPLLSEMVRRLRARRGEVQMQNLMMQGEIKGLQHQIDRILTSYQRTNPLPELDDHPVHGQRRLPCPPLHADEDDNVAGDDVMPKIMSATRTYNRALNLSLVLLNICRRQRQIHLHAEFDARERWRHRRGVGGGDATGERSGSFQKPVPYQGNIFMAPDAALMLRSYYGGSSDRSGARPLDMQGIVSMGF